MAEVADAQRRKIEDYAVWKDYRAGFEFPAYPIVPQKSNTVMVSYIAGALRIVGNTRARYQAKFKISISE